MANSGSNSNGSQFFITMAAARHLDNRHAVFGKVVGGHATLDKIEAVGAGKDEIPLQEIFLVKAVVFDSPYAEINSSLVEQIKERMSKRVADEVRVSTKPAAQVEHARSILAQTASIEKQAATVSKAGVGKYLSSQSEASDKDLSAFLSSNGPDDTQKKKQKVPSAFSDFSNW